ncbi:hypothetical protein BKA93DRAFT_748264 [Sparassis latifolia]
MRFFSVGGFRCTSSRAAVSVILGSALSSPPVCEAYVSQSVHYDICEVPMRLDNTLCGEQRHLGLALQCAFRALNIRSHLLIKAMSRRGCGSWLATGVRARIMLIRFSVLRAMARLGIAGALAHGGVATTVEEHQDITSRLKTHHEYGDASEHPNVVISVADYANYVAQVQKGTSSATTKPSQTHWFQLQSFMIHDPCPPNNGQSSDGHQSRGLVKVIASNATGVDGKSNDEKSTGEERTALRGIA